MNILYKAQHSACKLADWFNQITLENVHETRQKHILYTGKQTAVRIMCGFSFNLLPLISSELV